MNRITVWLALTMVLLLGDPWIDIVPFMSSRPSPCLLPFAVLIVCFSGGLAVSAAATLGLIGDCLAGSPLGLQMGIYALIAGAVGQLKPRRALSAVELAVICCSSVFSVEFSCRAARSMAESGTLPSSAFARQSACEALAAAVTVTAICLAGSILVRLSHESMRASVHFFSRRRRSLG